MPIISLTIFKRLNGIWYILYTEEGRTRWKSTGETLKNEALKKLTEFKRLLQSKPKEQTLSQFGRDFLAFAEGNYSPKTFEMYNTTLKVFRHQIGDCILSTITSKHFDFYKTERLKEISPVSVNIELRTLMAAFNTAIRWKVIENNPFCKVQLVSVPEQQPTYFTKEDFQRLISMIKEGWLKEVVIFAVITGMRRGEILNLKWQDVDLERKLILVQSNPTFKTKQGKRRTIPSSEVAYHFLNSKHGRSTCEYVFSLKDKKLSADYVTHLFKEYVRLAGLKDKLHFHSLRHTFASWLVQDGVSILEVQKLLGHSSITGTQRYSHLLPEGLHHTVNKISVALN